MFKYYKIFIAISLKTSPEGNAVSLVLSFFTFAIRLHISLVDCVSFVYRLNAAGGGCGERGCVAFQSSVLPVSAAEAERRQLQSSHRLNLNILDLPYNLKGFNSRLSPNTSVRPKWKIDLQLAVTHSSKRRTDTPPVTWTCFQVTYPLKFFCTDVVSLTINKSLKATLQMKL